MINQISFVDLSIPMFLALREGLEAVLVVVIIILYLKKTNQRIYYKYVYLGIILALAASVVFAIIFSAIFGGFTGILEQIFEGTTFIISGIFILTLVLWVSKEGPKRRSKDERKSRRKN
ncbi:MAG: FTR1 family protein [Promethearchaeota archaeon]